MTVSIADFNALNTIVLPQTSKGIQIVVSSGGYNMSGLTAKLLMQPQLSTGPGTTVSLPLVVASDGMSASYVTTGSEFTVAAFYTAQLKVTDNSNILLYSLAYTKQFSVQAVLG